MKYLFILILPFILVSCLGTKKTIENDKQVRETSHTEVSNDSISKEVVNQKIDDEFLLSLRTQDSVTNEAIKKALKDFKQEKKSGGNSTTIVFDEEALAFRLRNIIDETKSTELETNTESNTVQTKEEIVSEYVKTVRNMIPLWLWVIGIIFIAPQFINAITKIIGFFNPAVAAINKLRKKN